MRWLTLVLLAGCATTQADLQALRSEVRAGEASLSASTEAAAGVEAYAASLGKADPAGGRLIIGAETLEKAIRGYLPYAFEGNDLNKKRLDGNFRFTRARNLRFASRNRAIFLLDFGATDVDVDLSGLLGVGKKDERVAREALEGGGTFTIEASAHVDAKKNDLVVTARCVSVDLKRHDKAQYRDYLKDGVNRKLFARGKRIPLPATFSGKSTRLLTTPRHMVLLY